MRPSTPFVQQAACAMAFGNGAGSGRSNFGSRAGCKHLTTAPVGSDRPGQPGDFAGWSLRGISHGASSDRAQYLPDHMVRTTSERIGFSLARGRWRHALAAIPERSRLAITGNLVTRWQVDLLSGAVWRSGLCLARFGGWIRGACSDSG